MDKEQIMKRIRLCGVVPVATISEVDKAVPLAEAMVKGGIDVVEVTFRTAAAADAIRQISSKCPEMLVGAGTVITLEQCRLAVECGANFIVAPGFDPEVVKWCVDNGIPIVPGCVTPSEIMAAMKLGLEVVKFFPANIYGGLTAIKALSGPFPKMKFIPTSGMNADNLAEYIRAPFIYAVGGSWVCPKGEIDNGNFEKITALCRDTRCRLLGFEIGHIGINCNGAEESKQICEMFGKAFGFEYMPGDGPSDFSSKQIEIKKYGGRGTKGHIAIVTNSVECAIGELEKRGVALDREYVYENGKLIAAWLKDEIGGFAVHLMIRR
ncbi:MAG: bifunctional 4-hydroxy-2-oxoglutarate aldolase/2-dehydro-3-deoxy-phosphogluconate aldolase [Clostridiales bacterium]|nr:bifunctional 4-hydroxy-2-oxoglutarate aldolase/2-dehydro-3-deoxy-phosphogluconate aldolase [Clostridiales bacterium]